jgi:hypothetical protein
MRFKTPGHIATVSTHLSPHEIMFDELSSDGFQQPRCIRGVVLQLVLSRLLSCGIIEIFSNSRSSDSNRPFALLTEAL